jgi:FkbM family methyltransferase
LQRGFWFTIKSLLKRALPAFLWRAFRALWTFPRYSRNQLLLAKQQRAFSEYQPRLVRHNYGGFNLGVHLSDPIAEEWYDRDWIECPEIAFLRRHRLKSGCKVFDIGAHHCVVALMLARIVGPAGFVLAVEANPRNAHVGEKNKEINKTQQLHVLHAAIAAKADKLIITELFNSAVDDGTSGLGRIEVPALSIDDLTRSYGAPDVLFIDVEGFEHEAMKGAKETLKTRPDCFVEVHTQGGLEAYGGSVDSVISFFPESDYRLFMASEDQREFVPFARTSPLAKKRFFLIAIGRAAE